MTPKPLAFEGSERLLIASFIDLPILNLDIVKARSHFSVKCSKHGNTLVAIPLKRSQQQTFVLGQEEEVKLSLSTLKRMLKEGAHTTHDNNGLHHNCISQPFVTSRRPHIFLMWGLKTPEIEISTPAWNKQMKVD